MRPLAIDPIGSERSPIDLRGGHRRVAWRCREETLAAAGGPIRSRLNPDIFVETEDALVAHQSRGEWAAADRANVRPRTNLGAERRVAGIERTRGLAA
jgi:hypothetical protein